MSLRTIEDALQAEQEDRARTLDEAESIINFLRAHPQLPLPYNLESDFSVYIGTKERLVEIAPHMGGAEKNWEGSYFKLIKTFGRKKLYFFTDRSQVCTSRVVGKRTIPATEEREVDVLEWDCDDKFLNKGGEA